MTHQRSIPGRAWLAAAALTAAVVLWPSPAKAGDSTQELFDEAVAALHRGAVDDAIDRFELLADRGFFHPDASYDRALAYAERAQSHGARPGDFGRAAAALGETLLARPDDGDAKVALERIRQEIVRRRARTGASDVELKPSLGWAVVGLLDEDTWAVIAAIGSFATCVGLALRLWVRSAPVRLAGVVAGSLGMVMLIVAGSLAALSRSRRLHAEPAVVIVEEARLLDENGATISGAGTRLPEGALVDVEDRRGTLVRISWGTIDGWLSLGELRLLSHQ